MHVLPNRLSSVLATVVGIAALPATASAQFVNAYGGSNSTVSALAGTSRFNLVAAGAFTTIGGVPTPSHVARFNGFNWTPLGNNTGNATAVAVAPNGDVLVGRGAGPSTLNLITPAGEFTLGVPVTSAFFTTVKAIVILPGGQVVAGGQAIAPLGTVPFPALRCLLSVGSGTALPTNVGSTTNLDHVWSLAVQTANTVLVGGSYTVGGVPTNLGVVTVLGTSANVVPVNPPLPTTNTVTAIVVARNGDPIVAATNINQSVSSLFRLTGGAWSQLGTTAGGIVYSIRELPDGDVLVGGSFASVTSGTTPVTAAGLARRTGTTWSSVNLSSAQVNSMAFLDDAEFAIGGAFANLGGTAVNNIAAFRTPTPPDVKIIGSGCVGPGGANVLANGNNPFLNRPFALMAMGMAPGSLALLIQGLTPTNVQLPAPMQQGCLLFTSQDLLTSVPVLPNGTAPINVPIPDDPALLGSQRMLFQFTNFDVNLANFTTSNALSVRFGDF